MPKTRSPTEQHEKHRAPQKSSRPKTPKSTRSEGDGATTTKPRPQSNDPSQAENPKKKERKKKKPGKPGKKKKEKKKNTCNTPILKKKYTWFLCIFSFLKWENYQVFFLFSSPLTLKIDPDKLLKSSNSKNYWD